MSVYEIRALFLNKKNVDKCTICVVPVVLFSYLITVRSPICFLKLKRNEIFQIWATTYWVLWEPLEMKEIDVYMSQTFGILHNVPLFHELISRYISISRLFLGYCNNTMQSNTLFFLLRFYFMLMCLSCFISNEWKLLMTRRTELWTLWEQVRVSLACILFNACKLALTKNGKLVYSYRNLHANILNTYHQVKFSYNKYNCSAQKPIISLLRSPSQHDKKSWWNIICTYCSKKYVEMTWHDIVIKTRCVHHHLGIYGCRSLSVLLRNQHSNYCTR